MPRHAVEIRGLRKHYPAFELGPLDLTVPAGAIYGLVGPNGSGKTTTIDLMFGIGQKDAGQITMLGLDHRRDELGVKQRVGYVSPELDFRPWGRVGSAIEFVRGFYPGWDEEYSRYLLEQFRMGREDKISVLSFGSRIKLALVLALSWRPQLLVLDEPTVGLDAIAKQQVFRELLAAVRDGERTVLISSHGISDLERFADHVGMIKNGRLVFEGSVAGLLDRYRMVDFMSDRPLAFKDQPGIVIQERDDTRWRALVDREQVSLAWLQAHGAQPIADVQVSLEEVFVALGRE